MSIFVFHMWEQNTSRRTVNGFWKCLSNGTVFMEFRVCFAMAEYENDMFLLCETSYACICAFCYSKIHLHPSGPFKSIKTMLRYLHVLLGLSPVWNRYQKGGQKKRTTVRSIIAYDEFKNRICKD